MPFDVDAELLRWLCTDPAAIKLVDSKGIGLQGARVSGTLDLSFAIVPFPLTFRNTRFAMGIEFPESQLVNFVLDGGNVPGIVASNMTVRGNFALQNTVVNGEVRLNGATLGGNLEGGSATFNNPGKDALFAEHLRATAVHLWNHFKANGRVDLWGAALNGDFNGSTGTFNNPHGEVLYPGNNPEGDAVYAEHLTALDVYLKSGFSAHGKVDLMDAELSGDLGGDGGTFSNPGKLALIAENLAAARVSLGNGFRADGEVNLMDATLSGNFNAAGGTFRNPGESALYAEHLKAANVFLKSGFKGDGNVDLMDSALSGDLDEEGGTFRNPGKVALIAENLEAQRMFLRRGFTAEGEVDLMGVKLNANLDCNGGRFINPGRNALAATSFRATDVDLNQLSADGLVSFIEAHIDDGFFFRNRVKAQPDRFMLALSHASVGTLFDDRESWPAPGNIDLNGFTYKRFGQDPLLGVSPSDAPSRLYWLGLRPSNDRLLEFEAQPYEQLAKVLREDGDEDGATSVLIAMENARWWEGNAGFWGRCWSWILWATIGYGYDTWRALWFIASFVIVGAWLFFWGHESEAIVQLDLKAGERFLAFNPFVYSLETFLPLVELHQAKYWGPDPDPRHRPPVRLAAFRPLSQLQIRFGPAFGKYLRWYLWLHILAGWFFTSMLIAGITGLVQKE